MKRKKDVRNVASDVARVVYVALVVSLVVRKKKKLDSLS